MNLRHLVPTLGLFVFAAAPAFAADAAPASTLKFSGWVDTILSITDDDTQDAGATAKDEESASIRFSAVGSIKAQYSITEKLTSKMNLWVQPSEGDDLNVREAYFNYAFGEDLSWTMGKYINHLGWISAEPTGLFRVNASTIGYTGVYGNDVIGTALSYAPEGSALSGSFHITNGYFTASDANNGAPSEERENTSLGFGVDVIFAVNDKVSVNVDVAYDMESGEDNIANPGFANVDDGGIGGDVFLLGVNATAKLTDPLTLGAEIMFVMIGENEDAAGDTQDDTDIQRLQGLVMANYALSGTPIPMSVTGMIQHITAEQGDADGSATEVSLALLTNPLDVPNFGLNYEIAFATAEVNDVDDDSIGFFLEGITTF